MKTIKNIGLIIITVFLLINCEEPIDKFATSEGLLMGEYFVQESETFSSFHEILELTGTLSFVNAYGTYTCFAPTNNAVKNYLNVKGKSSLNEFSNEELLEIVKYHLIIDTINSALFTDGKMQTPTMYGHYLTAQTFFEDGQALIKINKKAVIERKDIRVINGIIHQIDEVLDPVKLSIAQLIEQDENYSIFSDALKATGLYDTLNLIPDLSSSPIRWFTVLAHSNDVYSKEGISSFEELKTKYSNTGNPKNTEDSLNLYLSYHILDNSLKYVGDLVTKSAHETYAPQEVITIRLKSDTVMINEDEFRGVIEPGAPVNRLLSDNTAANGVFHNVSKDYNVKIRLPFAIYWDLADQPEIRKLKSIFRVPGQSNTFNLGDLSEVTWGSENSIRYVCDGGYSKEYFVHGDYLEVTLRSAVIPWIEFTTPLIVKGKYKVWICTRNVFERRAIFMVDINGETLPNIIDNNVNYSKNPYSSDEELELTGYKRYNYNPADTASYYSDGNGRWVSRLAGTAEIDVTGQYKMKFTVLNNEMSGSWMDMVHFIPVEQNQIWPRVDKNGVLIYEPGQ